jgi:hypothetical protein
MYWGGSAFGFAYEVADKIGQWWYHHYDYALPKPQLISRSSNNAWQNSIELTRGLF